MILIGLGTGEPPVAKKRASRAQSYFPVKIPIYSLSGGVGRQIPSKRLPTEVQDMVNFFCTVESSIDKRNGTQYIDNLLSLSSSEETDDLRFHWMEKDNENAYIVLIRQDDDATINNFLKVYLVTIDSTDTPSVVDQTVSVTDTDIYDYLRYSKADLKFVNIGSALLCLNTEVSAGFTSLQDDSDTFLKDLDGSVTVTEDVKGRDIQYLTSVSVHRGHEAEVWVESQDYVWGQKVIDGGDPVYDDSEDSSDPNDFKEWRGLEWDEGVTRNEGGELLIDINTNVLALNDSSGNVSSYLDNVKWGTQISLSGLKTFQGTHEGASDATVMTDSTTDFGDVDELTGLTITNTTDGSSGLITSNTQTTITVTALTGGTDNDWDAGDVYTVSETTVTRNYIFVAPSIETGFDTGDLFAWTGGGSNSRARTICVNPTASWTTATTEIDFNGTDIGDSDTIDLTDGNGATITYTASTSSEDLSAHQFLVDVADDSAAASSLVNCIMDDTYGQENMHAEVDDTVDTQVNLTQLIVGPDGNQVVGSSGFTTPAIADFSGGTTATYSVGQVGSGWADAAALKTAIEHTNGHGTIFEVVANQVSFTDSSPFSGRVIIRSASPGKASNTKVWLNDYKWNDPGDSGHRQNDQDYNLNTYTANSVNSSFEGGVEDGEASMKDTFVPTWDSGTGVNDYWNVADIKTDLMYGIWQVKKYLPAEELPGPTNELLSEDIDPRGSTLPPHLDLHRWERVSNESEDLTKDGGTTFCNAEPSWYIPVEEYIYPTLTTLHLGQSVTKLSDLKFPPDSTDLIAYNGVAGVQTTLHDLYPDDSQDGYDGFGKILHLSQAYLEHTPGWYRVINKDKAPYLKKIRTPGKRAVIDQKRMPMMIYISDVTTSPVTWSARKVGWDHRTSGDHESNRGPGIFFDPSTGDPQESKINAMSFYRDRLFLANNDTIISSKSGDWDNFWMDDPDNITDTDPLDLMVSSNNYTPIKNLIPFQDFLFVGTSGNTQYELVGSQNIISPLTAEFAPTAFYPMITNVDPVAMNNSLFFFSKQKLFIYFGQKSVISEKAFEVSRHIPEYLPEKIKDITTSNHSSMIFALQEDTTPNTTTSSSVFVYRNQIANEKVVQNAFYRWDFSSITSEPHSIRFVHGWNKHVYLLAKSYGTDDALAPDIILSRLSLEKEDENIPRLDYRRDISSESITSSYDPSTGLTTITGTWGTPFADTIVSTEGEVLTLTSTSNDGNTYTISGNYVKLFDDGEQKWLGLSYPCSVEFSTTYLRDELNNIVPGVLNLRYCVLQTYNSKQFDVSVDVRNRSKVDYSFDQEISDTREDHDWIGAATLTGRIKEHQVRFPILGYNSDVRITASSNNPHPLNVASLQYNGKFKGTTRFHNS